MTSISDIVIGIVIAWFIIRGIERLALPRQIDHHELMRKMGLANYWKLLRKINEEAGAPPHAHDESGEEQKQCAECQARERRFQAIWEREFGTKLKQASQGIDL